MREIKHKNKSRKAQDEMVGFGLILIIVAIAFIIFITIYITRESKESEDHQVKSFVQALLQYTTTCQEESLKNVTVQNLIKKCYREDSCYIEPPNPNIETDPCIILNETIKNIIQESWKIGPNNPNIGYSFIINMTEGGEAQRTFLNLTDGNVVTNNYRIGYQSFGDSRTEDNIRIILHVHSIPD